MPKNRSSRRGRKGRKPAAKPPAAAQTTRVVAQPVAVAAAGEAPAAPRERTAVSKITRRDYSYVRRDLQRLLILAGAVIITIVVLSFFLP